MSTTKDIVATLLVVSFIVSCGASVATPIAPTTAAAEAAQRPITATPAPDPNAPTSQMEPPPMSSPPVPNVALDASLDCTKSDTFGPIHARPVIFDNRYGALANRYSDVPTTSANPIEACGIGASLFTLKDLACDDGSNPFSNEQAAHASRVGSVGAGGRCGSIIDLYRVVCPEKTYDIHIDTYFCGP